ncbi:MAG: Ig-like domain-containing protein, partial [Verrucomicrobiota bacterium]
RGEWVYVLGEGWLGVCRSADLLESIRRVAAPGGGGSGGRPRRLSLDVDRLFAQHTTGFNVFDLTEPSTPSLVADRQTPQSGWRQLVATGTGMALAADGPTNDPFGPHDVSLYRLTAGGQDAAFVSTFVTPGSAYAVSVAGARGLVADGEAGLVVINYLPPDLAGVSPVAAVTVDSAMPSRLEGGSTVRVAAVVSDDVAVRQVEFLVNGRVLARDDRHPFEVFLPVPPVSPANPEWSIQVRAVDLAGNTGLSPVTTLPIVADATPPPVVPSIRPPGPRFRPPASGRSGFPSANRWPRRFPGPA